MHKLWAFFCLSFHFGNRYVKVHMLPFQALQSKSWRGIRNNEVNSIRFENAIDFFHHLTHRNQRIIAAHESVNRRLIKHHIKLFIWIGHITNIHDFIDHLAVFFLQLNLLHLLNAYFWNVVIDDFLVACLIKLVLYLTVSASNIENLGLLVEVEVLLDNFLKD